MDKITAQFETIIDGLLEKGYAILDNFLEAEEVEVLNNTFSERKKEFKQAGISKNAETVEDIRGDEILWIDEDSTNPAEKTYLNKINNFIAYLNQTCYLGLQGYELHYASYPVGTFYKRHLDRFQKDSARKFSIICYLNQDWQPENGGELVLYLPDEDKKILPIAGRLICFESEQLEHEVLPATQERRSITGWLRR